MTRYGQRRRRSRTTVDDRFVHHYVYDAMATERYETLCGLMLDALPESFPDGWNDDYHSPTALLTRKKPDIWTDFEVNCSACILLGMLVMAEDEKKEQEK